MVITFKAQLLIVASLMLAACSLSTKNNELPDFYENFSAGSVVDDVLPKVETADLHDNELAFPFDFTKQYNFVVFDFQDKNCSSKINWINKLKNKLKKRSDVAVLNFAIYDKTSAISRGLIRDTLRQSHQQEYFEQIFPIFIDSKQFFASIGLSSDEVPHIVLFENTGYVLWRGSGNYHPKKLKDALAVIDTEV